MLPGNRVENDSRERCAVLVEPEELPGRVGVSLLAPPPVQIGRLPDAACRPGEPHSLEQPRRLGKVLVTREDDLI